LAFGIWLLAPGISKLADWQIVVHALLQNPRSRLVPGSDALHLRCVSRKTAIIKFVNLEEGMPTVERARLRLQHELALARKQGCQAVKIIHGYGSSGAGGALRLELQKELRRAVLQGTIRAFIAGEDWRVSSEAAWDLLKKYPEWKQDSDLGRNNQGISIVVL
jgi:hypothetical protein